MKTYNKPVRDKIPQIIQAQGKKLKTRILSDEEHIEELLKKLVASTPKPLQEIDMQMLANKAVNHETVGHKQIEEGFYALISFGSLLFIIAGLVLKQLSKLKVGTIELEKATLETASASVSLNIRQ